MYIISAVAIAFLLILSYYLQFIRPHIINFSYADETCVSQFIPFPSIQETASDAVSLKLQGITRIGSLEIAASRVCIEPTKLSEHTSVTASVAPFGGWFAKRSYIIDMPAAPNVTTSDISRDKVSVLDPLSFKLTKPDAVSEYSLEIAGQYQPCDSGGSNLSCDLSDFSLKQNKQYAISIHRTVGSSGQLLASGDITTVMPLKLIKSSIENNSIRYDKPTEAVLTFDKPLRAGATASLILVKDDKPTEKNDAPSIVKDKTLTIKLPVLDREAEYRITTDAIGSDGSAPSKPLQIDFKTSGGPKVIGVSIGHSGVARSTTVVVQFDQAIDKSNAIAKFVSTSGVNSSGYSISGKSVSFQISGKDCQTFSVNVAKGIKSGSNGAESSTAWSYDSRIICGYSWTIGYSVQGRPIVAYSIGSGSKVVMFTGGMHGSEPSGYQTMQAWAEYLRANPDAIPYGVRVVVVPNTNPDGIAANSRNNARGVNIDRNFPDSTWESDITTSSGVDKGGGGKTPASEPETKAIMNLTRQLRPRLQVSFHAQGSLVGSNNVADADAIGQKYANANGYATMFYTADEEMGYNLTGQYEMWEAEELGLPAILIELPTPNGNYLYSQLPALKLMLKV